MYNTNSQIQFKTSVLNVICLCDNSDAYILVSGSKTVPNSKPK